MFPLFASNGTSAAHGTTDSCSELIGLHIYVHILVVRNNSTPTINVGFSFKTSSYIVKTINICTGILCTGIMRYTGILRYTGFPV